VTLVRLFARFSGAIKPIRSRPVDTGLVSENGAIPCLRCQTIICLALLVGVPLFAQSQPPKAQSGKFEVTLRPPADGLFAREEMQLEFRLVSGARGNPSGATEAPVLGARLRCVIDMPSMPSMPKFDEIAHPEGIPGEYGVHPTFPHGGAYRLRISSLSAADPLEVEFPLAVNDVSPHPEWARVKPFSLQMATTPGAPRAGEPSSLQFSVRRESVTRLLANGREVKETVVDFDAAHEKLMHLFIVRADLGEFAHEHPQLVDRNGTFRLNYTFPTSGEYRLFADVAPKGAGSQVLLAKLLVGGTQGTPFDLEKADLSFERHSGGVHLRLLPASLPLPVRKTFIFTARLTTANGRPLTGMQPYLGAMGHLLLVHQDGVTFVHAHPDERIDGIDRDARLPFLVRFPKPGRYRGWVQFQHAGELITIDFVVSVPAE
jgi:hypothetical protein